MNGAHLGDEGDDPHRLATTGAEEREDFLDPCEQHGPEIASTGMWLGVGLILRFGSPLERRVMDGSLHREACAGRHRHAQRGIGARSP